MAASPARRRLKPAEPPHSAAPLTEAEKADALGFLAERPLHTVIMAGWLREHGVVSQQHRGSFYRSLNSAGKMSGVALIGRNTFFEVRAGEALTSLARVARQHSEIKMVFGEAKRLAEFWRHYVSPGQKFRLSKKELLFEIHDRPLNADGACELNRATTAELDQVVKAHAEMVRAETGVDPLAKDARGFRERCAARIGQGRVWVLMKDGELVFKTDVVSNTPEVLYIEGLWVNPKFRGRGVARKCISGFCRTALNGSNSVCGFVEAENLAAQSVYRRTGFSLCDRYEKVYL